MTMQKSISHRFRLFLAVAASLAAPAVSAQPAQDSAPRAGARSNEQERPLVALDAAIGRFSALVDEVTDVQYQAVNKGFLADFTNRSLSLRNSYDQTACNDLRLDLNIEYQRLAAWLVTQSLSMPVGNAERGSDLTLYFVRPAPAKQSEMKAARDALDREIGRLQQRTNMLPAGPNRTAEENRIKLIRQRRAELETGFTKDRWDALIGDMKKQRQRTATASNARGS